MMSTLFLAAAFLYQPINMEPGFVRTLQRTDGVAVSQTAARKYTAHGKPDLWLVGVAHIGLTHYYGDIQNLLDAQDYVLFEGVRPKDGQQKPIPVAANAPKQIYQIIGQAIGLDFQLTDIHYDRPHWINSDLTMDQLVQLNKSGGKGKATQFDMVKQMLDPKSPQSQMMASFFATASPGTKEAFKIFLVEKLAKVDTLLASTTDATTLNVLLKARNQSVLDTFGRTLTSDPAPHSVAVFYGAAHQSDLARSFKLKYGYREMEQRWFTYAKADRHKLDDAGRQFLDILGKGLGGMK